MIPSLLLREEVVSISRFLAHPSRYLKGVVRLVDKKARAVGLFLDAEALDDLLEDIEASDPKFLAKLETSRKSGRVSAKSIERRLGV